MKANPIAIVVLALVGLAAALKVAYDHSEGFRNIVNQLFDWLGNLLTPLGWVWEKVMDLAKSFGLIGDATEDMKAEASTDFEELRTRATTEMQATSAGVTGAAQDMKKRVSSILDEMADAGVGASEDMKVRSILEAMGMQAGVLKAAEDMASGFGGWSEQARDKAIFDMQYAALETTLRAKGLADGVIAEILRMVVGNKAALDQKKADDAAAHAAMAERYGAMKTKQAELADSFAGPIAKANELRDSIDRLHDKTVTVNVNYNVSGGGGAMIAAAGGYDGIVGPGFGGPRVMLVGEGTQPEEVHVRPAGPHLIGSHLTAFAAGGEGVLMEPTLLVNARTGDVFATAAEHGPEEFAFGGRARGGRGGRDEFHFYIDGREIHPTISRRSYKELRLGGGHN